MSEQLIDATHPTIRQLEEDGFKITMHVYLRDGENSIAFTAHNKQTKRTFNGRSRTGDREEALRDLARDAGITLDSQVSITPEADSEVPF